MLYLIGDFSKISRLSIRTLRYYHEIGILSPPFIDKNNGYRYYDEASIKKARIINELKALELSLGDIKEILNDCTVDSDIIPQLRKKLIEVNNKLARYSEIKERIEAFIKNDTSNKGCESFDIIVKEVPNMWIAFSRFKGSYSDINHYLNRLFSQYQSSLTGSPFSLYYDDDSLDFNADIEVCIPISKAAAANETKTRILKGGRTLSIIHKGSYESLYNSYKILVDYIRQNELTAIYPIREIYLKGRGLFFEGAPENYITEIQFPLG